jgi:alpha-beta hydrolase superfamily lysophospholipase
VEFFKQFLAKNPRLKDVPRFLCG